MNQDHSKMMLFVSFATMLVMGTDLFVVSPLLPSISQSYQIPIGLAGLSVTAFSLAYVVGAPLIGSMGDKIGHKNVLVFGLLGFAISNILTSIASSYEYFIVFRAMAGLAAAASSPSVYALVGQAAPPGRRGLWMSTAVAGFLISLTIGAPIGIYVSTISSWHDTFILIAALSATMALFNWISWKSKEEKFDIKKSINPLKKTSTRQKIRAVSVTGAWGFSVYAMYTYLGSGLISIGGFNTNEVASALIIYGIGAVFGSLSGGKLADSYGAGKIAALSLILLASTELIISEVIGIRQHEIILLSLGLFALVAYPCLPAYQAKLVENFPGESGKIMALNSSVMYLGTALGAAFGGFVIENMGFSSVSILAAAVGLLGSYLCFS